MRKIRKIKKFIRFLAGVAVGFGAAELLKREKQRRADLTRPIKLMFKELIQREKQRRADARSWSEFSKRIDLNQY